MGLGDVVERTAAALAGWSPGAPAHLPAEAIGCARIAQTWLAGHEAPSLALDPCPEPGALRAFLSLRGS